MGDFWTDSTPAIVTRACAAVIRACLRLAVHTFLLLGWFHPSGHGAADKTRNGKPFAGKPRICPAETFPLRILHSIVRRRTRPSVNGEAGDSDQCSASQAITNFHVDRIAGFSQLPDFCG